MVKFIKKRTKLALFIKENYVGTIHKIVNCQIQEKCKVSEIQKIRRSTKLARKSHPLLFFSL